MKTPMLFEVENFRPSLALRITEFKKLHHILTHRADFRDRKDHPWSALLVPEKDRGKDMFTICAESCRIYDDAGILVTGEGELSAIRTLCERNNIFCDL